MPFSCCTTTSPSRAGKKDNGAKTLLMEFVVELARVYKDRHRESGEREREGNSHISLITFLIYRLLKQYVRR